MAISDRGYPHAIVHELRLAPLGTCPIHREKVLTFRGATRTHVALTPHDELAQEDRLRVSEMRQREDYDGILHVSLQRALDELHSGRYTVQNSPFPQAQLWRFNPTFSAYFSDDVGAKPRRFLADSFRFTRVAWRAIPQFVLGTAMATGWALRHAPAALWIAPALPNPDQTLIVPGNRRVRIFDFHAETVRVSTKVGFDLTCMINEIAVRSKPGPFPRVIRAAGDCSWFDEPIVSGWTLARCPPWISRRSVMEAAFVALEDFCRPKRASVQSSAFADERHRALEVLIQAAEAKFGKSTTLSEVRRSADVAAKVTRHAGDLIIGPTHGDMQAGNVLLDTNRKVLITDWEHYASRLATYDRLVFEIGSRSGKGLRGRLVRHLRTAGELDARAIGAFLLEDLTWFLRESLAGPFPHLPASLIGYARELRSLDEILSSSPS